MLSVSLLIRPLAGRRPGAGLGRLVLLLGALMLAAPMLAAAEAPPDDEALLEAAQHLHREQPALFAGAEGVLVMGVVAGSQAEAAGVRRGDILLRYGGHPLDSAEGLIAQTQRIPEADEVGIALLRDGELLGLTLRGGRMGAQVRSLRKTAVELIRQLSQAGATAQQRADYPAALAAWQQGLAIAREQGHQQSIGAFLGNIGIVHRNLGNYSRALDHYRQALAIRREIRDRRGEGNNLINIGNVYENLGDYPRALDHYRQALAIHREIGDRRGEGADLTNIGAVYLNLGQYPRARDHCQQALAIDREIGNRPGEGTNLLSIGLLLLTQQDHPQALAHLQQALAIQTETGALDSLWRIWNGLRQTLAAQSNLQAAILAGKQAVNTLQAMRGHNQALAQTLQQSFLSDKTHVYQGLVDLLVEQGRLPEAELVLAMYKEEEYYDFIRRRSDGPDPRHTRIACLGPERPLCRAHDQAAAALRRGAKAVANDQNQHPNSDPGGRPTGNPSSVGNAPPSPATGQDTTSPVVTRASPQLATLKQARARFDAAIDALLAEWGRPVDAAVFAREAREQSGMLKAILEELGHGATLIYYLIGEQKLTILVTPGGDHEPFAHTVPVTRSALNQAIGDLRSALRHPHCDPRPAAQALYALLFKPIAQRLRDIDAQTLSLYLDGALRYLPLAALHDGQHYLVERYPLAIYNAAARHVLNDPRKPRWRVAALGLSTARLDFSALPGVPGELAGIVRQETPALCPGEAASPDQTSPDHASPDQTTVAGNSRQDPRGVIDGGVIDGSICLDQAFTRPALERAIAARYPVLHIASHFKLSPGNVDDSYLLLGGEQQTLPLTALLDRSLHFRGVDLLTLSACDTALGDGAEIEGFGTLAQNAGAKSVIATLWKVTDRSTALFMQHFYGLIAGIGEGSKLTKAEALRQTQVALLRGEIGAVEAGAQKGKALRLRESDACPTSTDNPERPWGHPYYWAPFILMGNWL